MHVSTTIPIPNLNQCFFVKSLQILSPYCIGIHFAFNFAKILKNTIRHIAIYLLTATVLVASTGFSVCCMFGCHDYEVASGIVDCCEKQVGELPPDQSASDCPDCNSQYISLDADYLFNPSNFKTTTPQVAVLQTFIISFEKHNPCTILSPLENDLPPPPYGKALLPLIQSFLC